MFGVGASLERRERHAPVLAELLAESDFGVGFGARLSAERLDPLQYRRGSNGTGDDLGQGLPSVHFGGGITCMVRSLSLRGGGVDWRLPRAECRILDWRMSNENGRLPNGNDGCRMTGAEWE
jgi:hypothetical protein